MDYTYGLETDEDRTKTNVMYSIILLVVAGNT
jgi:hypothetical protein